MKEWRRTSIKCIFLSSRLLVESDTWVGVGNESNCLGISCPVNSQSLLVLGGGPGVIDLEWTLDPFQKACHLVFNVLWVRLVWQSGARMRRLSRIRERSKQKKSGNWILAEVISRYCSIITRGR